MNRIKRTKIPKELSVKIDTNVVRSRQQEMDRRLERYQKEETSFISWNDIAEFRPAKVFGFRMIKDASIVVTRSALTPFHRLYGLMYGKTNQPSLLIWSYISNYENLVTIIKENLKRSRLLTRQKTIQNPARTQKTNRHKSVSKN